MLDPLLDDLARLGRFLLGKSSDLAGGGGIVITSVHKYE
jgi:hypothetical protein